MTDSGEKTKLHPIRTLRLEAGEYDSPELTRTNRLRPNFTTDSGKLSAFEHQPVNRGNTLNTILGRAQHAKRESFIHNIQGPLDNSPSDSNKSESHKSSITNNDTKNENYSPKKSVFGEYSKIQEPFDDDFQRDYHDRESNSPERGKEINHYYFDDVNSDEPNFFQRNTLEGMQLPKINRQSFCIDRRKNKRSSIDFINGVYPLIEDDDHIFKNLAKKPVQKPTNTKKKRIKKKSSRPKGKRVMNSKSMNEHGLDRISEGSEEKQILNAKKRYFDK
jgi:hypothetical protein